MIAVSEMKVSLGSEIVGDTWLEEDMLRPRREQVQKDACHFEKDVKTRASSFSAPKIAAQEADHGKLEEDWKFESLQHYH